MRTVRRVSFVLTGGFVPQWRGCDLETSALSAEEAATLAALVQTSGILTMRSVRIPNACDVATYRFEIETEEGTHTVAFDTPVVPESVRPLLGYLLTRSRDKLEEVR